FTLTVIVALAMASFACAQTLQTTEAAAADTVGIAGNLMSVIRDGGPMLIPLAVCSFLLFLFGFERAISLRRGRVIPKPFVRRFIAQLEDNQLTSREALIRCRENGSPIAEVFAAGVMKWDRSSVEVEQAIIDAGERVAQSLRRYLRLFNGISTISPLLGLLGTVIGMIKAFNSIASADAMGKPELLASGISQALLTTAAGLTVAIPALVIYLYFASRADRLVMEIDRYGQDVVNAIAVDGWKEKKTKKAKSKAA
ncbi:MAG: MotA/TolQ/ExbB proton channel family protein, partial [Planctomycetota bacterium]